MQFELGVRVKLKAKEIHDAWEKALVDEWTSHEGVVIGFYLPDENGRPIAQIAWSGGNLTQPWLEDSLEIIGDDDYVSRVNNMNSVYFDRSEFLDVLATPPMGKWRCKTLAEVAG